LLGANWIASGSEVCSTYKLLSLGLAERGKGGGEGRDVIGKKIYYCKTVERNPFLIFIKFSEFIAERG
jgi:hypothetical protein